jgi:hypothetical protein
MQKDGWNFPPVSDSTSLDFICTKIQAETSFESPPAPIVVVKIIFHSKPNITQKKHLSSLFSENCRFLYISFFHPPQDYE